jgi:hypothetical protein
MSRKPDIGYYYELDGGGLGFIESISSKGNIVGLIVNPHGVFGPVSWDHLGMSQLKRSRYNIREIAPSGCRAVKPDAHKLRELRKPVSELLKIKD